MIEDIPYSRKVRPVLLLIFIFLMFVMLFYFDRVWGEESRDPKAVALAEKMIVAMGGMDQWKAVKAVRFDFVVEPQGNPARRVKHLWDRRTGRDHVEWERDGKRTVAWVDLSQKTGNAWTDSTKLQGAELKAALDTAHARWVNDTYWMIMPWKTLDTGVNLKHEGARDGHQVLHLSFGKVGLTPGDQYWAFVNNDTGLMDSWEYLLEDGTKGSWVWKEWGNYGGVKLSKLKESADKKVAIRLDPLRIMDAADPSFFGNDLKTLSD